MITKNISKNGEIIGTMTLPETATEEMWNGKLNILKQKSDVIVMSYDGDTMAQNDNLLYNSSDSTYVFTRDAKITQLTIHIDNVISAIPCIFQIQKQQSDGSFIDIAELSIVIPVGSQMSTLLVSNIYSVDNNTSIKVYYKSGDVPSRPRLTIYYSYQDDIQYA